MFYRRAKSFSCSHKKNFVKYHFMFNNNSYSACIDFQRSLFRRLTSKIPVNKKSPLKGCVIILKKHKKH